MSSRGQAWDEFFGGPSAAEFEESGVFCIVELFLDVSVDEVFEAFSVFGPGSLVFF